MFVIIMHEPSYTKALTNARYSRGRYGIYVVYLLIMLKAYNIPQGDN